MQIILLFVVLTLPSFALSKMQITPVYHPGLIFLHDKDILLKSGTYYANVETRLNPTKDIEKIAALGQIYDENCSQATATYKTVNCDAKRREIYRLIA